MVTPFCYIGIHNWEYKKEKHPVTNHPEGREFIRVIVRECQWCGHREHHHLPRINKKFHKWESWDSVKKDEVLNYIKLHENEIQNTKVS